MNPKNSISKKYHGPSGDGFTNGSTYDIEEIHDEGEDCSFTVKDDKGEDREVSQLFFKDFSKNGEEDPMDLRSSYRKMVESGKICDECSWESIRNNDLIEKTCSGDTPAQLAISQLEATMLELEKMKANVSTCLEVLREELKLSRSR
jgi:hypothetical protein